MMLARKPTLQSTPEPVLEPQSNVSEVPRGNASKKGGRSSTTANASKPSRRKQSVTPKTAPPIVDESLQPLVPLTALAATETSILEPPMQRSKQRLNVQPSYQSTATMPMEQGLDVSALLRLSPPQPLRSLRPLTTFSEPCPYRLKWNEQAVQLEVASDDAGFVSYTMNVLQHPLLPPVVRPNMRSVPQPESTPQPIQSNTVTQEPRLPLEPMPIEAPAPVKNVLPPVQAQPSSSVSEACSVSPATPPQASVPAAPDTSVSAVPQAQALVNTLLHAFESHETDDASPQNTAPFLMTETITEANFEAKHTMPSTVSSGVLPSVNVNDESANPPHLEAIWQQTLARFATLEGSIRFLQTGRSSSKIEVLMVTAWHCTQKQQPPKRYFTLRELQQSLASLPMGSTPHTLGYVDVEQALDQGLLEIVPDVTGLAITTDYTLTPMGSTLVQALLS